MLCFCTIIYVSVFHVNLIIKADKENIEMKIN